VIPPNRIILLDTNILILLARGKALALKIEAEFKLTERPERPLICVVSVGEALAIARKHAWGGDKLARLQELLRNVVVADINATRVLDRYSQVKVSLEQRGFSLSDNDKWIAAVSGVTGAVLLTTDKDFDPLHPDLVERVWLDPKIAP
jgi:tRNA(fMet)-specific endonuclease VapC